MRLSCRANAEGAAGRDNVRFMLEPYRRALELPGAWQFSSAGFVARLPIAMIGLGIVILISDRTGSYAAAGILGACFQLPAALGAVATSRWIDRVGQHRLLPWLTIAHALLLVVFVVSVESGAAFIVQAMVIALAGLSQPAIGSMVRARWANIAPDAARLRGAFALESVIDELIFSIGPPITALIAFQIGLPFPIIVAAVIAAIGGVSLSLQRRTEPLPHAPHDPAQGRGRRSALLQPGLALVPLVAIGIGAVFGSFEVAVVAFTRASGDEAVSGLILGVWAFASMIGGIWFGARTWRLSLGRQMLVLPALLAASLLVAPLMGTTLTLTIATAIGGLAAAPALIAAFSLTERLVPARQLTEGLTWTNSGLAIGFSLGTALAGFLVDGHGPAWGFWLAVGGASFAALVGAAGQRTFSRHAVPHDEPDAPPVAAAWNADPLPGPRPGGILGHPQPESAAPESPATGS